MSHSLRSTEPYQAGGELHDKFDKLVDEIATAVEDELAATLDEHLDIDLEVKEGGIELVVWPYGDLDLDVLIRRRVDLAEKLFENWNMRHEHLSTEEKLAALGVAQDVGRAIVDKAIALRVRLQSP